MADIYDDPTLKDDDEDFLRLEQVGDRVEGTITTIDRLQAKFGPVLKYTIKTPQGREASFLAGSKNLKGQLMSIRPRPGDQLDITLVELRPTQMGSPLKVFQIVHTPAGPAVSSMPPATPQPPPGAAVDDDLFAG